MSSLVSAFDKKNSLPNLIVGSEISKTKVIQSILKKTSNLDTDKNEEKNEDKDEDKDEEKDDIPSNPLRLSRKRQRAEADAKRAEDPERICRTLFFGNVALSVTRQQITRMLQAFIDAGGSSFSSGNDIESVRLRSVPIDKVAISQDGSFKHMIKAAVAQKTYLHGKNKKKDGQDSSFAPPKASMTAYAVFKTEEAALKCLELDGTLLEGKHLRVDRIDNEKGGKLDYKRTIFVGNLPFTADEDDIRAFFNSLRWESGDMAKSAVEAVRIVRDRVTHKGKGIAFVLFSDRSHVVTALGLGQKALFKGRTLRIERCSADGKAGGVAKKARLDKKVTPKFQGSIGDASAKVSTRVSTRKGEPTVKKHYHQKKRA